MHGKHTVTDLMRFTIANICLQAISVYLWKAHKL